MWPGKLLLFVQPIVGPGGYPGNSNDRECAPFEADSTKLSPAPKDLGFLKEKLLLP